MAVAKMVTREYADKHNTDPLPFRLPRKIVQKL